MQFDPTLWAQEITRKIRDELDKLKTFNFGDVTEVIQKSNGGYQARVLVDGASTASIPFDCMTDYIPAVGDHVMIMYPKGSSPVIMGATPAAENTIKAGSTPAAHGYHVPTPQTANNAVYLRNDNTWQTISPSDIGAAPASHGNHVPTLQTANNAVYLRNDNTWQTISPSDIGAAPASHTHSYLPLTGGTLSGGLGLGGNDLSGVSEIWGAYGLIARSTDEWLRLNEDKSHTNGIYCGTSLLRTDGELQVGSAGGTFRASSSYFTYKGDNILRGYSGTVKCVYMNTTQLSARITYNITSGTTARIVCTPRWVSGQASMIKVATVFAENVSTTGADIKIYCDNSYTWGSAEWMWVDYIVIPDV